MCVKVFPVLAYLPDTYELIELTVKFSEASAPVQQAQAQGLRGLSRALPAHFPWSSGFGFTLDLKVKTEMSLLK